MDQDLYLRYALEHLRDQWMVPNVGIVAACIWNDHDYVCATSTVKAGLWTHAEVNALLAARANRFRLKDCHIATTLSPCCAKATKRAHLPCLNILTREKLRSIRYGALDVNQLWSTEEPDMTQTNDPALLGTCNNLYEIFSGRRRTIDVFDPLDV